MAKTTTDISDVHFDTGVSNLGDPKIGVQPSAWDLQFQSQFYDEDVTKPSYEAGHEIEEAKRDIDVAGGSKAISGDVDESVLLFGDEEKEADRKKLTSFSNPLEISLNQFQEFASDVVNLGEVAGQRRISPSGGITKVTDDPSTAAREDRGEIAEKDLPEAKLPVKQIGISEIQQGIEAGQEAYDVFTFEDPAYGGEKMRTTSPYESGLYLGSGVDLGKYTQPYRTGLGTTATQASVGLSSPPPASLAGTGKGVTSVPPPSSIQSTPWMQTANKVFDYGMDALNIYSGIKGLQSDTLEGKYRGYLAIASTVNPTLKPFVLAYDAIKMITGWGGIGRTVERWFGWGKPKPGMGGVEYRTYDSGTGKAVYPDDPSNPGYDEALEAGRLKIQTHTSWGYNGFPHQDWRNAAQKNADYLYDMADNFGLEVNADVFMKAAIGARGFPKHKPGGDRQVSWLERVDNVGNGAPDPGAWLRTVLEYKGPNGEKIISGNPISQNIDETTGLRTGFETQEAFEQAMAEFNQQYA